jgi:AcrR family transcriptional regulator
MDKAERRAQILAKAREVFARLGYHAATVDDIVLAAGIARGTFYLYFEDKRAVFAELVDRFLARLHLTIQHIDPDDPSHTVARQIRGNIFRVVGLFLGDRAVAKILLTDALGLDADFDRKLRAVYDELFNLLEGSLRMGQGMGLVAEGDPRVMAYLSVGAMKELFFQSVIGGLGEHDLDRITDQIFGFLANGYLRIPGPRSTPGIA